MLPGTQVATPHGSLVPRGPRGAEAWGASALSVSTSQGTEGARLDGEDGGGGAPIAQGQNCKGDKKARPGREEEAGV